MAEPADATGAEAAARRRPTGPGTWRWVGCAGGVALAAASWGAGALPRPNRHVLWPGLAWWSPSGGSPLLATASVVAMALLVLAWWRLRDADVSVPWWWRTVALWFAPLVVALPLYSRDVYSYAAQGLLWDQGLSPYDHVVRELDSPWRAATAPTWLDSATPYGPVWLLLARGIASVSGELWVALLLLRLLAVVGVVVLAWAVPDVAGRLGWSPVRATWLGVAVPLVGAHFVGGAHNDAVMVGVVLAGLALALRGRFVPACVLIAVAAMVKVTAVIALPFVALLWARHARTAREGDTGGPAYVRWAAVLRTGVLTAVCAGVPMALGGLVTGLGFSWLNPTGTPGKNEQWTSLPTAIGIAVGAVGHVLGHDAWREQGIATARAVALVVLAVLLLLVWLAAAKPADLPDAGLDDDVAAEEARLRPVRGIAWALLAVVVLAPVFLGWYYLWVLPLFAVSLGRLWQGRLERPLAVVASVVCFATLPEGYSLGLTTTAVGVPVALVALVLLLRRGWCTARRVDWRHLLDLERPLVRAAERRVARSA
ncbi:polyprenol phosphomannose-dependent alpha 1,6 mannosyltransferase MptB [Terrabacter sp. NPDC080008]|uniref:polyprenol phosphomannose-dependent alpha 1,6 mannosyltransferase MptB n=1 Tax=Terrabacter sp. NPDC080008 TaxID=3155176 RepID=UPI00344BA38B